MGCTGTRSIQRESSIDAQFQWKRRQPNIASRENPRESPMLGFYRSSVSAVLGSHCSYFPSDSAHAKWMITQCGPLVTIPTAMARFLDEPDAISLGKSVIGSKDGPLTFKHIRTSCDFIETWDL